MNGSIIKLTPIPIPPIEEQKFISKKIDKALSYVNNIQKICQECWDELEFLSNSILMKSFEGKLVPQDPNDEPAEVLLEKIKQEKQKIIKVKPGRKKND